MKLLRKLQSVRKLIAMPIMSVIIIAQSVPVTFHFDPPINNFQVLRLVGSFNGWNNSDNTLIMEDSDGDGEFTLTTELPQNVNHNYKFVLDADWGQAFTDPHNPRINTSDNNNSMIEVTDPIITYLLPRDVTTTGDIYIDTTSVGVPIRVVINHSPDHPIDIETLVVTIDGVPINNPSQYFIQELHEFTFQPQEPLSFGEHTITASISSELGTVTQSSTYLYEPNLVIYTAPVDFYFDSHNSRLFFMQSINAVSLMGSFNNWNNQFNPMTDLDEDGVWETTVDLEENEWEYKFQLNTSYWTNDWDNPEYNPNNTNNNLIIVMPDSTPSIKLLEPTQGTIFSEIETEFIFRAKLRSGTYGDGINESSIQLNYNESLITHQFNSETNEVSAIIFLSQNDEFTHISVFFENGKGITTENQYTFGVFPENSGYHFVDAFNDIQYIVPDDMSQTDVDIHSLCIEATGNNDILHFTVKMGGIHDKTRLGLLITNPVNSYAEDSRGLDLLLQDWNNEGIFVSISPPNSSLFNAEIENRFQENREPTLFGTTQIIIDESAILNSEFVFDVELAYFDSLLGGWNQRREFTLFSYIASDDGSGNGYEVTIDNGGIANLEDPDVFDAAFIRSAFWQNRILSNYIIEDEPHGARLSALDGHGRGVASLYSEDISDSLANFGPVITFLTPSEIYWYENITIAGTVDDESVTTVNLYFNETETILDVIDGVFTQDVTLTEGNNITYVYAEASNGYSALSEELFLTYEKNHNPTATILGDIQDLQVTFTAVCYSPDDLNFSYLWSADENNPANLIVHGMPYFSTMTVTVPGTPGEYYIDLVATDSQGRVAVARHCIIYDGVMIRLISNEEHAGWIDDAIIYEIYPRSFTDQGGFAGIIDRIPDMLDLGINTIWLMPIYTGPTTHGYEITDYYGFEEDFGTEEDFRSLVDALHNHSIRIILDFVVNHTSIQHPFMQNVFEYNQYSPWADFYLWNGIPGDSNYEYFFDWASLPNLNHNNSDVRKYFIDVATHWVNEYDIDGYRCDVAWGVEQRNPQFWQDWRSALKNIKPEIFLEAEASAEDLVYFDHRFDSANDWNLRNRIREAIDGTTSINELNEEFQFQYPVHARPLRFLENHDEIRMAASHDTERSKLAHTLIMTANGIPLIYSGGEVGELTIRDMINWSDPDNIRPYFKTLIEIRKNYIHNPVISQIPSSQSNDIYTYTSTSNNHILLTVANLRPTNYNFTLDLSGLPFEGSGSYYLTDLFNGTIYEISEDQLENFSFSIDGHEANILYYASVPLSIDGDEQITDLPKTFNLHQNYPNPFNPSTTIRYNLPEDIKITLRIYDITGRVIRTLVNHTQPAGIYKTVWNGTTDIGKPSSSGMYFAQIQAGDYSHVIKMLYIK